MFVLIIEQHKVIISTQSTLYLHSLIWNQGVKFKIMLFTTDTTDFIYNCFQVLS